MKDPGCWKGQALTVLAADPQPLDFGWGGKPSPATATGLVGAVSTSVALTGMRLLCEFSAAFYWN